MKRVAIKYGVSPVFIATFFFKGGNMKKIGDYIVCRKQVCRIKNIKNDLYVLEPVDDPSLTLQVPINSNVLRDLITKKDIDKLLKEIPIIDTVNSSDRLIEQTYKELMHSGTYEDLIKIIKTTYLRNEKRKNNKKKISEIDNEYFNKAESYLYNEFSVVLNLSFDETKEYVINKVSNLIKN